MLTARVGVSVVLVAAGLVAVATSQGAATPVVTPATSVPTYIDTPSDGLTIGGSGPSAVLYSFASCGSEFTPAVGDIYSHATGVAEATLPVPYGDLHQLYDPADCNGAQPVGERVAVWGDHLYWIGADGVVYSRTLRGSSSYQTWPMAATPPLFGDGTAPGLVVDDHALTWTGADSVAGSGMALYEVLADTSGTAYPGAVIREYHVGGRLSRLTEGPGGTRFVIASEPGSGSRLSAFVPTGNGHFTVRTISIGTNVTAVTADNGAVYWAESNSGAYVIYQASISVNADGHATIGTSRPVTSRSGFTSTMRVTNLVVDPASTQPTTHDLWWSILESGRPEDPAVMHLVRTGGRVDVLLTQTEAPTVASLATDGQYLFWTDTSAVYRAVARGAAPHLVGDPLSATDVSPDLPYLDGQSGDQAGSDPGGRLADIVVDPNHSQTLIAASEFAGIWRSTNGGQSWVQSNAGIQNGYEYQNKVLAIDHSGRLLYFTLDEGNTADGSTTARLYVSRNDGVSWQAVPSSAIPQNCWLFNSVTFTGNVGWVSTTCGLYKSSDLVSWTRVGGTNAPAPGAYIDGSGASLFACRGNTAYLTTDGGTTWWGHTLPNGTCQGVRQLAAFPSPTAAPTATVIVLHGYYDTDPANHHVDLSADQITFTGVNTAVDRELTFPTPPDDISGILGVWVAPIRSGGGDVIASNGNYYFQYAPGNHWNQFTNVHIDAEGFASPPTYDPSNGDCVAYVANDGSVAKNVTASGGSCQMSSGPWMRAQSGLHAFGSQVINGVHRPTCNAGGFVVTPCSPIYVGAADNGAWEHDPSTGTWAPFTDCCGDVGGVQLDPALPGRLELTRGTARIREYLSSSGVVSSSQSGSDQVPADYLDLDFPSSPSGSSLVRTQPGEAAVGDDVAVRVIPDNPEKTEGVDQVVRRTNGGGWTAIAPELPFDNSPQLATSGGHHNLVVWVRTEGFAFRGAVNSAGQISSWTRWTSPNMAVSLMWANPADPNELWIEDDYNHVIERSSISASGGVTWTIVRDLTSQATGSDARFATSTLQLQRYYPGTTRLASLNHMWFPSSPSSPMRVATLGPGGVSVSHDGGDTWLPLSTMPWAQWLAHPWSTWFDPGAYDHGAQSALYIALDGRGVEEVTAPFETLVDVNYQYCGVIACDSGAAAARPAAQPADAPSSVSVVDDLTGRAFPMTQDADGSWRATEMLDGDGIGTLHYHFVVDGVAGAPQSHVLSDDERDSGTIGAAAVSPGPNAYLPGVGTPTASSPVAVTDSCPGVGSTLHVSVPITVPAGTDVTGATLVVRAQRTEENGDVHQTVVAQVPMTAEKPPIWSASVDTTALGINLGEDAGTVGGLVLQVVATAKGGPASSPPITLALQACPPANVTVPSAPISIGAKPTHGGVLLSWQSPSDDGGLDITGYQVTPYRNGKPLPVEFYGPAATGGAVLALSPKSSYTFTVRAINDVGAGAAGGPVGPTTPLR